MELKLQSLKLKNFKLHRLFELELGGSNADIYGDNQVGKTTVYDAFLWLLFDKNSEGKTDFSVKPVDMERPEVEVEGVLLVDGREVTLKKILTEKWTKRRGSREESFTGHETKYYINSLEVKMSEYKAYLETLASEDSFRRLTSAAFFLSLKKQDMRSLLVKMAGEDQAADDNPEFAELLEWLADKGFTVEEGIRYSKQQLTTLNAEQKGLGGRIDEVQRAMPEEPEAGWDKVEQGLATARKNVAKIDEQIGSQHLAKLEVQKTQGEIATLENEIRNYRVNLLEEANQAGRQARQTLQHTRDLLTDQSATLSRTERQITAKQGELKDQVKKLDSLKEKYKQIMVDLKRTAETVYQEPDGGTMICELCNQQLPADQIAEHHAKHKELFNTKKTATLAGLEADKKDTLTEAHAVKEVGEDIKTELEELAEAKTKTENEINLIKKAISEQEKKIEDIPVSDEIDLSADQEYQAMLQRLDTLKGQLTEPEDKSKELAEQKQKYQDYVERFIKLLNGRSEIERGQARITELTDRGKEITALIAVEKQRTAVCEDYIRHRAEQLTDKINSMFTIVKFRLFQTLLNGAVADDCTPMVKTQTGEWVDMMVDGSNSERIRGGLDIVNVLQKHEGMTVPVFVDNAEAATWLIPMECQIIRLVVSEPDKKLRVEIGGKAMAEQKTAAKPKAKAAAKKAQEEEPAEVKPEDQINLDDLFNMEDFGI